MAPPRTDRLHYEYWETLEQLLGAIDELRQAYKQAPKDGFAAAAEAERRVRAELRSDHVKRVLADRLGSRPAITSRLSRAQISDKQIKDESDLGPLFGYKPSEVKRYIDTACRDGASPPRINSADELEAQVADLHAFAQQAFRPTGGWRARRRALNAAREEVDRRLFGLGVIVADILRPQLFVTSYAVGASRLLVTDG